MKVVTLSFLLLATAGIFPTLAQNQGNAPSGKGKKTVFIRGEDVGFVSVSPALENEIEKKHGKKPDPNPGAMGPNAEVGNNGFTYVSPAAKGKKK